jgi:small subunit ribosomal protein S6
MAAISMRDEPGTLREYHTLYVLRPETAEEGIAQVNGRIRGIIAEQGGKLLKIENWGKRRLAYEIKKQLKGIYLSWRYLAPASVVAEIERNLRMLDPVVRYFTVRVASDVKPESSAPEVDAEQFAAAARVRPDEEEIALGAAEPSDTPLDGFEDLVGQEEE